MAYKYVVVDLETSINNVGEDAIGDNKASPYHPDNQIVYDGWKPDISPTVYTERLRKFSPEYNISNLDENTVMVGHNIAFDLHYLLKQDFPALKEWLRTGSIWDTQLAEFIISGQTVPYPSLDYCAEKYGGTLKDNKIKEYWNAGVKTEDIPQEELEEYLRHDVLNTELVFLSQLKIAKEQGLLNLIRTQMDARLATIEMEHNGMYVDRNVINNGISWLTTKVSVLEHEIYVNILPSYVNRPELINLSSDDHLSIIIFGGELAVKVRTPLLDKDGNGVVYKSGEKKGQQRYTNTTVRIEAPGIFFPKPEWALKKEGFYSTAEDVLKSFPPNPFIDGLLQYRELKKDLSTYYEGYKKLLWPTSNPQYGVIHQSLNHCVARTGRLSCTKPNLQNVSGDD